MTAPAIPRPVLLYFETRAEALEAAREAIPREGATMPDPLDTFTTDDLQRLRDSSWREAARCWAEYRAARADVLPDLAAMLEESAREAESLWRKVRDAYRARITEEIAP
jgi:hypothetical protein